MNIKQLFTEDEAVSPVIGVILMVAITVILAAVIGTFVLGLGDQVQSTSPQASFNFDYNQDAANSDELDITHDGGDSITASQLSVTVSGANQHDVDEDHVILDAQDQWSEANLGGYTDVSAGTVATLSDNNFDTAADGTGDASDRLDLSSASVRVVWNSESGDSSATLGSWTGPDA